MKTPMQEMIEFMKEKLKEDTLHYNTHPSNGGLIAIRMSQFYLEIAESMLTKEKEFFEVALRWGDADLDDFVTKPYEYYKAIYNIKEK